ncbi:MAG: carboxypeptidase regulatory-like domain-containing protein [Sedimentisphaerales bacterium]|nr:carboxypeptidase regulatory-like domain-containing protein [Sedimentisphaerales bacterium]
MMNAIVQTINSAGQGFATFALPMLIQSSVLILILLLVDLALRRKVRAVFRYWIWLLVLVKLLLPPSLWSPLSVGSWVGQTLDVPTVALEERVEPPREPAPLPFVPLPSRPVVQPQRNLPQDWPDVVRQSAPPPGPTEARAPTEPAGTAPAVPTVAAEPSPGLTWQGLALLVWATVAGALLLLLLQRAVFVRGLVAQADPASDSLRLALDVCRARLGLADALGVRISANATSPAVCGLLHPVILIPRDLLPKLRPRDLEAVLLHELAHIKRGDLWVNLFQTLLQVVYFYNPLLWLANAMIRRVREKAVDEAVLVALGESAEQYPETLLHIAKLAFRRRPALSLRLIGVVESRSALRSRIRHMLTRPIPKTAKLSLLGMAVLLVVAAVLLPMAKARTLTERARSVTVLAEEEARALNHDYIGTEHILLALARQEDAVSTKVLWSLGVGIADLRSEVEKLVQPGDEASRQRPLRLTPRAQQLLDSAAEEAKALGHSYVGTEHILLALAGTEQGAGYQMLGDLGLARAQIRSEILRFVRPGGGSPADVAAALPETWTEESQLALRRALIRDRMPLPTLAAQTYYEVGEPIRVYFQSAGGRWKPNLDEIEHLTDREVFFVLIDGIEYECRLGFGLFGNIGSALDLPDQLNIRRADFRLPLGKHAIAYGWRGLDVFDPNDPDNPVHFDRLLTDPVEFEVVEQIPADYYRPVYEEGWEAILRSKVEVFFTDDTSELHLADMLLGLRAGTLPFDLAFDMYAQAEGSEQLHPAGQLAKVAGSIPYACWCDRDVPGLDWDTVGDRRWRLVFKPSVQAARERPPIHEFYAREFVTDWLTFERSPRFEQRRRSAMRRQDASGAPSGRVVDSQGNPIVGAALDFQGWDAVERKAVSLGQITTDSEGHFAVPPVDPGEHINLTIEAAGYCTYDSIDLGRRTDGSYWPEGLTFTLRRTGAIEGTVLGPDGLPLAGAPLSLTTTRTDGGGVTSNHLRAITDASGHFRIDSVPPGIHLLYYPWSGPLASEVDSGRWQAFRQPGQRWPSAPVEDVLGAVTIELDEAEEITDALIDLSKSTCAIEGQVRDTGGRFVGGAKVAFTWKITNANLSAWGPFGSEGYTPAVTDSQGRYRMTGLPPGDWHIKASHPNISSEADLVPVHLGPGRTVRQDLRLPGRLPPSIASQSHRVYLPDCETPEANVVLDLATGQLLSIEPFNSDEGYFERLGQGDIVYEYARNRSSLLCMRGATLQRRTEEGLEALTPDGAGDGFTGYYIDAPASYQVTTAEGSTYDLTVLSIDPGDDGGIWIEYTSQTAALLAEGGAGGGALVGEDDGWGRSDDGVRLRLRPERLVGTEGQPLQLALDLQNEGPTLTLGLRLQLELDGQTYVRMPGRRDLVGRQLSAGETIADVPIVLGRTSDSVVWRSTEDPTCVAELTPGNHSVRIIDEYAIMGTPVFRRSNPVEIEILPFESEVEWGPLDESLRLRMRPDREQAAKLYEQKRQDDNRAYQEYSSTCRFLYEGGDRAEAARRFGAGARLAPFTPWGRRAADLSARLERMAEEQVRLSDLPLALTPADVATLAQKVEQLVYSLRDVAVQAYSIPDKCRVLRQATIDVNSSQPNPAGRLRQMAAPGEPGREIVIERLIQLLTDRRPTRSWTLVRNGGHVLCHCDVALEILADVAGQRLPNNTTTFDPRTERDAYLGNADEQTQAEIIARVKTWWAQEQAASIADAPVGSDDTWGSPADGVVLRLRPERIEGVAGRPLELTLDIHNGGSQLFRVYTEDIGLGLQLELDGQFYYRPSLGLGDFGRELPPGVTIGNIPIVVGRSGGLYAWRMRRAARERPLELTAGTHSVRVALARSSGSPGGPMSNPVEIRVLKPTAAAQADAADDSGIAPTGINIYLLADENIDLETAYAIPLSELELQPEPWIASDDIEMYDHSNHCIYLKETKPASRISLKGTPFVVTADGQRCYLGSLWTAYSSYMSERTTPLIYRPAIVVPPDVLCIERRALLSDSGESYVDVREDPRVLHALTASGKLHAGLNMTLDRVEALAREDGSSVRYTYTLRNRDTDNLYIFDPDKMGVELFHYYNPPLSLYPAAGGDLVRANTDLIKPPGTPEGFDMTGLTLLRSGQSMTRTVTVPAYPSIPNGVYVCSFYLSSPGRLATRDKRVQPDGRIWVGEIVARLNVNVASAGLELRIAPKQSDLTPEALETYRSFVSAGSESATASGVRPLGQSSLVFDGVDDCLIVPASTSLRFKPPFFIEVWAQADPSDLPLLGTRAEFHRSVMSLVRLGAELHEAPQTQPVADAQTDADGIEAEKWPLVWPRTQYPLVRLQSGGFMGFISRGSGALFAVRQDGSAEQTNTFYVNQLMVDRPGWSHFHSWQYDPNGYAPCDGPLVIGGSTIPGGLAFKGRIAEVRIWNRELPIADIKQCGSTTVTGSEPNLVACWTFDEGSGQIVHDISPNGNHAFLGTSSTYDDADPIWLELPTDATPVPQATWVPGPIQEKIDAADAGDTITLPAGVFEERLVIDKPLVLQGAGWDQTTIVTRVDAAALAQEIEHALQERMATAADETERRAVAGQIRASYQDQLNQPVVLVTSARGVVLRDVKLSCPGTRIEGRFLALPVLGIRDSGVRVIDCAVLGSVGDGIHIADGSNVEIADSLVAAAWGTGVAIGGSADRPSSVRLHDCDIRNCHYAGVRIRPGNDDVAIERCRISGAAWHGIRYDDASPDILSNLIFGNARSGIYASGRTRAVIANNLFCANEMCGLSCWFRNEDLVVRNTFAQNERSGLEILGASQPAVRVNIFYANPVAISGGNIADDSPHAKAGDPVLPQGCLFWANDEEMQWRRDPNAAGTIVLDGRSETRRVDPQFVSVEAKDFSLQADSPARQSSIGASDLIPFASRWPLQPEETAIIPGGDTRDYRQWKRGN